MPIKPIPPAEPEQPDECPKANAGQIAANEQIEEEHQSDETEQSWIEIEFLDEAGTPVPGERYKIKLPNGKFVRGTLDENGFARVEGIPPGSCEVTFTRYDESAWEIA